MGKSRGVADNAEKRAAEMGIDLSRASDLALVRAFRDELLSLESGTLRPAGMTHPSMRAIRSHGLVHPYRSSRGIRLTDYCRELLRESEAP